MRCCPCRALLALSVAVAASALAPQPERLSYAEAVSLAVDIYNHKPRVASAFRLLEAKPQLEWDPLGKGVQQIAFRIKETTCQATKKLIVDKCPFRDDGLEKECSGTLAWEKGSRLIQFHCKKVVQEHIRDRRDFCGKDLKKLGKKTMKKIRGKVREKIREKMNPFFGPP